MIHITDWLPTLITAAGGDSSNLTIDGMDLWNALSEDTESPRASILHNIDDIYGVSAVTVGNWKLIQGKRKGLSPRVDQWNSQNGASPRGEAQWLLVAPLSLYSGAHGAL